MSTRKERRAPLHEWRQFTRVAPELSELKRFELFQALIDKKNEYALAVKQALPSGMTIPSIWSGDGGSSVSSSGGGKTLPYSGLHRG